MNEQSKQESQALASHDVYQPPQVESVLTAEELVREVQYAGNGSLIVPVG